MGEGGRWLGLGPGMVAVGRTDGGAQELGGGKSRIARTMQRGMCSLWVGEIRVASASATVPATVPAAPECQDPKNRKLMVGGSAGKPGQELVFLHPEDEILAVWQCVMWKLKVERGAGVSHQSFDFAQAVTWMVTRQMGHLR
jgi:hypothetical protein